MPVSGIAVATAGIGSTVTTMILSKLRCFCKESTDGQCMRGCGFTDHSLFDDKIDKNEVQLEKASVNGVEVIYFKRPLSRSDNVDECSSCDDEDG